MQVLCKITNKDEKRAKKVVARVYQARPQGNPRVIYPRNAGETTRASGHPTDLFGEISVRKAYNRLRYSD